MKYLAVYDENFDDAKQVLSLSNIDYEEERYAWDLAFRAAFRERFYFLDDNVIDDLVECITNDSYLFEELYRAIDEEYRMYETGED